MFCCFFFCEKNEHKFIPPSHVPEYIDCVKIDLDPKDSTTTLLRLFFFASTLNCCLLSCQ